MRAASAAGGCAARPRPLIAPPRRADGKDWCYDYLSCSGRYHNNPTVMSSNGWPDERAEMGLFSPNPAKNPFAGANYALLGYCSSDAWVGDVGASVLTYSFSFRGQRILCVYYAKALRCV